MNRFRIKFLFKAHLIIVVICNNYKSPITPKKCNNHLCSLYQNEDKQEISVSVVLFCLLSPTKTVPNRKATVKDFKTAKNDNLCCVKNNIVKHHSEKAVILQLFMMRNNFHFTKRQSKDETTIIFHSRSIIPS